jgi:hypothetical protein
MVQDFTNLENALKNTTLDPQFKKRKNLPGCLLLLGLLFLVIGGLVFLITQGKSLIFPNSISGDLLDAVYVPDENGKGKLWILTDGSFRYTSKTSTPSSYSIKSKGLFCKTWLYIYDPENKSVESKLKTEYDALPPKAKLYYINGKVWKISNELSGYDPEIITYNPKTFEQEADTKDFIEMHPELKSGISKIIFDDDRNILLKMETKDGLSPVYELGKDKIYKSYTDYVKSFNNNEETLNIFALGYEENNNIRKKLYYVTGPASKIGEKRLSENIISNEKSFDFFYKSKAKSLAEEKIFIEGIILYENNEQCLIIHQDKAGKIADKILTCINKEGKILWSKNSDELYEDLATNEKEDSFSSMFFMKSKIHARIIDNVAIFKFDEHGLICFELINGNEMWRFDM